MDISRYFNVIVGLCFESCGSFPRISGRALLTHVKKFQSVEPSRSRRDFEKLFSSCYDWSCHGLDGVIRCPRCGNDLVYSPIPPLYFCLDHMVGDCIMINLKCEPWIAEDASADDLLELTERIGKLAVELQV